MNNQNNNIYQNYQNSNKNVQQQLDNDNNIKKTKSQKVFKVIMLITLVLIVISLGGFALVYTGVIRVNYVDPESILLNSNNIGVRKGIGYQYDYQVYPENSTAKNVYYESSDESIATVNSLTGYVTPLKEGTVKITVKSTENNDIIESSLLSVTKNKVKVTDIKLSSERIVFDLSNKNTSQLIKVTLEPYNATSQSLNFKSSNTDVAIVDASGRVFPVGFGMATITVSAKDSDASSECEVIVTDSQNKRVYFEVPEGEKIVFPYSIQLDRSYLKLRYGDSRKVGFTLLPPDVTEDVVTWISADPNVATVKDGVITGIAVGQTTITARTINDLVATLTVDVVAEEIKPETVDFVEDSKNLEVGDSEMIPQIYDDNATISDVTWKSSNPDSVIVDSEGNISAVGPGKSTITAETENGDSAKMDVTVDAKDTEEDKFLQIADANIELASGETKTINVASNFSETKLIYRSSNENVVTVNDRGVIYGKSEGIATITISTIDGLSSNVNVTVKSTPATKISLVTNNTIEVGETREIIAEVYPSNATNKNLTWESSNPNILSVSNGEIKGISEGTATITAKIDKLYNQIDVNVIKKIDSSNKEKADELITSKTLNQEEIERLKNILLEEDENYKEDNKKLLKLDLEKYGFNDYVKLDETKFEIDNTNVSKTFKSIKTIVYDDEKEGEKTLNLGELYVSYDGYGDFEVKTEVTLNDGTKVELLPTKITIHPLAGTFQNSSSGSSGGGNSSPSNPSNPSTPSNPTSPTEYLTTLAISIDVNSSKKLDFSNYQDIANSVSNWQSSNSGIVSVSESGVVTGIKSGTATITGSYQINSNVYKFQATVIVKGEIISENLNATLNYGECYSAASLCPNGGSLVSTTIPKNANKCTSTRPYYVDKLNYTYQHTCRYGNVSEKRYYAKSGSGFINDATLQFNIASGHNVRAGEKINIKILNWDKLGLEKISYNAPGISRKEITNDSITITIPKTQKNGSYKINFSNGQGRGGRIFSGDVVLNVVPQAEIVGITCSDISVKVYEEAKITCNSIDANNQIVPLNEAEYHILDGKNNVNVSKDGIVSGLKAGDAKIQVKALKKETEINVKVGINSLYTSLELKLNKTNKSPVANQLLLGEEAIVTYTAIGGNYIKTSSGLNITYIPPTGIHMDGNKLIGMAPGKYTLKARFTNVKGEVVEGKLDIIVVEKGKLDSNITKINCPSTLDLTTGSPTKIGCVAYDEANDMEIDLPNPKYTIKNSKIATIKDGIITPLKVGVTTVTVSSLNFTKDINVSVNEGLPTYNGLRIAISDNRYANGEVPLGGYLTLSYLAFIRENTNIQESSGSNVIYTSSDSSIASVMSTTGVVTASKTKTGTVTISAHLLNTIGETIKSNSITIKVVDNNKLTSNITRIGCQAMTLQTGETKELSCQMLDSAKGEFVPLSGAKYEISSGSDLIAVTGTITKVTAKKAGTAKIKVSLPKSTNVPSALTTEVTITVKDSAPVYDKLEILSMSPTTLEYGTTAKIRYRATDSKTKKTTTSGLDVAIHVEKLVLPGDVNTSLPSMSVDNANSQITLTGSPNSKIHFSVYLTYKNSKGTLVTSNKINGSFANLGEIKQNIVRIGCTPASINLSIKSTQKLDCNMFDAAHAETLKLTNATFTSSNSSIVSVDKNGTITAKKAGKEKITISKNVDGKTLSAQVTVNVPEVYSSITASSSSTSLKVGGSATISYTLKGSNSKVTSDSNVVIRSTNDEIVSVNGNKITAKKVGSTNVVVQYVSSDQKVKLSTYVKIEVYEDKTCYRYKAASGTTYQACGSGYHRAGTKNRCYKKLSNVNSSLVCGYKYSNTKWWNGACYQLKFTSKAVTAYSKNYSYTASEATANKGKDKKKITCKNTCSASACK